MKTLLKDTLLNLNSNQILTFKKCGIEYQASFKFLPFSDDKRKEELLNTEMENVLTPIFHFE